MPDDGDLIWESASDRLVLSPVHGGRILSWITSGVERVNPPLSLEGGLLRVLFAEEQYPGTSYVSPHAVIERASDAKGFRIHLRHFWNAPNALMRLAGWPEKANLLHLDHLLLDKIVTFDAAERLIQCELRITNLSEETKYFTPWLHNSFSTWPSEMFVVIDGERRRYADTDIYWGSHVAEPVKAMRLVHGGEGGKLFAVIGGPADSLAGMCGYLPIPGDFLQAPSELRFKTVTLLPGQRWRADTLLMLTGDWSAWSTRGDLATAIEPAPDAAWSPERLVSLLEHWALPAERERGFMALSFLDKPPFSTAERYDAAHVFAGFHAESGGAVASTVLTAIEDDVRVSLDFPAVKGWALKIDSRTPADAFAIPRGRFMRLALQGPADLAGAAGVRVLLRRDGHAPLTLRVASDASVEPRYPFQVKQLHTYLEERWGKKTEVFPGKGADAFRQWQRELRARHWQWMESNATGRCEPLTRLVERQEGPTCIREKLLIQTEPDLWMPGYLVRPKDASPHSTARMPLLFFVHGSGPGKQMFAGDEDPTFTRTQLSNELELMPYRLARDLRCLVYTPDMRGCGEQGETNPAVYGARLRALGISYTALRTIDLPRTLDALLLRGDVDPARVGSLGCSGGGGSTLYFAAVDERVAASIVSSTHLWLGQAPPEGYFKHMFAGPATALRPDAFLPCSTGQTGTLIAPRPLWIMDGRDDAGIAPSDRPAWWAESQAARDEIARAYRILGARERYEETWFEGGHCAGITNDNAVAFFRKWLG